ncbi:MAG: L-fuculose-phosphate aldolase [Pseudonocardiales bacterium]|jgi:L-fuculose-phosphate aldolase|nr:L-fuculose-phosphate aldolase [Pseudonocardiales bacterium]
MSAVALDTATVRLYLAAGRRILAREGAGSASFGLLAARHAGSRSILITPAAPEDTVSPDDIVEVDVEMHAEQLPARVSRAAGIALAVLRRRADVTAIVHTHSHAVSVLSTTRAPIGMYNEMSTLFFDEQVLAEDDGDRGSAACERLAATLGSRRVLILPGHGMFSAAPTLPDVVIDGIALEKAANWDLAARGYGGAPIVQRHLDQTKPLYDRYFRKNMWEANLRRLQRDEPALFERAAGRA